MEGRMYGYVRVSTHDQNTARQLAAMRSFGVAEENIVVEKLSGKDFDRPGYRRLVKKLRRSDVLVVKSIDRLGRNYEEILKQWEFITKERAADGISLVQTVESALAEVHETLNRMIELATQSANGTYDDETDRNQLQKELQQLLDEVDRIAESSNFNGIKLLDGSLDAGAVVGAQYISLDAGAVEGLLPPVGEPVQSTVEAQGTVLEDQGTEASQAGFEVDLENLTVDAAEPGTFTLNIAGNKLTGAIQQAGVYEGADLAQAVLDTSGGIFTDANGNQYTVEAQGSKLIFKTDAWVELKTDGTVVPGFLEGSAAGIMDGTEAKGLPLTDVGVSGGLLASTELAQDGKPLVAAWSRLDNAGIQDVINEVAPGAAEIKLRAGTAQDGSAYNGKLVLEADGKIIGVSAEANTGAKSNAGGATTYTFTGTDENATALGDFALVSGMTGAGLNRAQLAASLTADGVVLADLTVTPAELGTAEAGADLAAVLEKAGVTTQGASVSVAFKETDAGGNDIYTITADGVTIDATGTVNNGVLTLSVSETGADGTAVTKELLTIAGNDGTAGTATMAADFQARLANAFDTGITYGVSNAGSTMTGTVDGGIQNPTGFINGVSGAVANTTVDFGQINAWQDGAKITLGDTTYTVALGPDSLFQRAANVIDLTDRETADGQIAAQRLAVAAKGNKTFIVGHDGAGKTTLQQRLSAKDSTDMTTREKLAGYLTVSTLDRAASDLEAGASLVFQIGDSAEDCDQLTVDIKEMSTAALGVSSISVANQQSAAAAIQALRSAIDQVSDVRGTLGAAQNRLDHTINNLSVMAENIQDSESTIRDVDVAAEMMAYTKNNILIQSAQAMLAQANQVPQGVLQLMQ